MFESSINPVIMSKSKIASLLFVGITMFMFSSCGKSYKSSENSIPIDIYLSGPMGLSEEEIEKNDSLAILLNLIDGRMPQMNFHRLDLGDSVFRDTIEMGFFNSLFEEFIDINDMKEDLMNKEFGDDLRKFLTQSVGSNLRDFDTTKYFVPIDTLFKYRADNQILNLEKIYKKSIEENKGRIIIRLKSGNIDRLKVPPENKIIQEPIDTSPNQYRITSEQNDDEIDESIVQDVGLTYSEKSNTPKWKGIKNATKIQINVTAEGNNRGMTSVPFDLHQQLVGSATQHSFAVQGGENSARTFQIQIEAYDINGNLLKLSNNVLNGVKLSCTR